MASILERVAPPAGLSLGIHAVGHDTAVALLDSNGEVLFAAEEERYSETKAETRFPEAALRESISHINGRRLANISIVNRPSQFAKRMLPATVWRQRSSVGRIKYDAASIRLLLSARRRTAQILSEGDVSFERIRFLGHHYCHAFAATAALRELPAAVMVLDGRGENLCALFAEHSDDGLRVLNTVARPHSIGLLYQAVASEIGLTGVERAGKLMGLSGLGSPAVPNPFARMMHHTASLTYEVDPRWLDTSSSTTTLAPAASALLTQVDDSADVAASLQEVTTALVSRLAHDLSELTSSRILCLGGGVAMNSVIAGELSRHEDFDRIVVPAAPHDGGLALGAAVAPLRGRGMSYRPDSGISAPFWGPCVDERDLVEHARQQGLTFESRDVVETTVGALMRGEIVGLAVGRMEYGPRALGHRSILAAPTNGEVAAEINRRTGREAFRPFGCAILQENLHEWFGQAEDSPNMSFVGTPRSELRTRIPAVVHADGSSRYQTVGMNGSLLRSVLEEYFEATGVPLLLNTSLNERGAPIANSARTVLGLYKGSVIDLLVTDLGWLRPIRLESGA